MAKSNRRRRAATQNQNNQWMKWLIPALMVLAVAVGAVVLLGGDDDSNQTTELISSQEYVDDFLEAERDYFLLDVRTADEFSDGHLEDAYNISHDELSARLDELEAQGVEKGDTIVVYCRSGRRSGIATQTLLDAGYEVIYDIDGGLASWNADVLPIAQ